MAQRLQSKNAHPKKSTQAPWQYGRTTDRLAPMHIFFSACFAGLLLGATACDKSEPSEQAVKINNAAEPDKATGTAAPPKSTTAASKTPPAPMIRDGIRLLVLQDHSPPLASEERAIEKLVKTLRASKLKVTDAAPTEAEKSFVAQALQSDKGSPEAPSSWAAFEDVVAVRLVAPRDLQGGKRETQGKGDVLIFDAASAQVVLAMNVTSGPAVLYGRNPLDGARLARWLLEDRRMRAQEAGK